MIARIVKLFTLVAVTLFAGGQAAFADAGTEAPFKVVQTAVDETLHALHTHTKAELSSPRYVNGMVSKIILPAVDIDASAKLVLGRYWRTATPAQRSAFVEQFKLLLIHTYAKSLTEHTDSKVVFLKNRDSVNPPFATIYTQVQRSGQQPLAVDYSLIKTPGGWKVYDITISGLSLVTNYRSTFGQEIAQTSLEALIKRLTKQNEANNQAAASS
ncbi:MlaC/ttg2D family ABC transporter substrate-binding protein [Acidihalobacter prosperus]|uniref:ABC transporter, auxiliary component YrbC n=1 Tax=Acidihalobacter prosperus TaxID=160660 RepID=A0A1A6C3G3_9GAMM|nr:ABC transporter substrate-binding protein [Acidihalobacter prosperus]OBS09099.1 putative ABC transporter, auxiliary component YrbC [Acidihalobacter prosperus]